MKLLAYDFLAQNLDFRRGCDAQLDLTAADLHREMAV